jgi:hypothetical protein
LRSKVSSVGVERFFGQVLLTLHQVYAVAPWPYPASTPCRVASACRFVNQFAIRTRHVRCRDAVVKDKIDGGGSKALGLRLRQSISNRARNDDLGSSTLERISDVERDQQQKTITPSAANSCTRSIEAFDDRQCLWP